MLPISSLVLLAQEIVYVWSLINCPDCADARTTKLKSLSTVVSVLSKVVSRSSKLKVYYFTFPVICPSGSNRSPGGNLPD